MLNDNGAPALNDIKKPAVEQLDRLLSNYQMLDTKQLRVLVRLMTVKYGWPSSRYSGYYEVALKILEKFSDTITEEEKQALLWVIRRGKQ